MLLQMNQLLLVKALSLMRHHLRRSSMQRSKGSMQRMSKSNCRIALEKQRVWLLKSIQHLKAD